MKNNYPIKYAVMPVIEQTGWYPGLHELEREYGVVCYIASKCYLVGREERYNMYGGVESEYNVVFPYEKDKWYQGFLSRVEPRECLANGRCNNAINVDKVFDSFEEAKVVASKKNKEILSKELSFIRVDDNFLQNVSLVKEKHEELVNYYQNIESMIEDNSIDLVVNDKVKEQAVIIEQNNSCKKKGSLYHMINFYANKNFIAYNISLDDFKKIEKQLKNGEQVDVDSIKKNCLLISSSWDKKVKVINCDSIDRSCFYIEEGSLYYDDKLDFSMDFINDNTTIVYTVETYDDVINSYIVNYVTNWDMPKNKDTEKVFRKIIKLR